MQAIRIGVVRGRQFHSSDGFQVYGDRGSGTIDWVHPVSPRRQLLWEDAAVSGQHLRNGHCVGPHLDGVRPDGHLEGTHLLDACLWPAAAIVFETDAFVFGRFSHGVVTEDGLGNANLVGVTVHQTVVNSAPEPAFDLRPSSYDMGTGRLTLTFVPSDRLVG